MKLLGMKNPLEHLVAAPIHIGPYHVDWLTNHVLMIVVAAVLMCVMLISVARQRSMVPKGLRNMLEMVCSFIRNDMAKPLLKEHTDDFIYYLWTIFFFILLCNLLGMVPTESILYLLSFGHFHRIGGTATGNIWVTGALAVTAFFVIHISGLWRMGLKGYIVNFIPHVPKAMIVPMYILEFMGAMIKPCALAIRLFANMIAGHAVIGSFIGLFFLSQSFLIGGGVLFFCALFSVLELFVAFLQAYIFTFLTTNFIAMAIAPEH